MQNKAETLEICSNLHQNLYWCKPQFKRRYNEINEDYNWSLIPIPIQIPIHQSSEIPIPIDQSLKILISIQIPIHRSFEVYNFFWIQHKIFNQLNIKNFIENHFEKL